MSRLRLSHIASRIQAKRLFKLATSVTAFVTVALLVTIALARPASAAPAPNAADLAASQSITGTVTSQIELLTPPGSGQFGTPVMLTNGNFVVADPFWDNGATQDVGAVYLYNGTTLALISRLTGSTAGDRVGQFVEALPNGNFVVVSPRWDNGGVTDAGAVTWVDGSTGLTGTVGTGNSLYGTSAGDQIGVNGLTVHPAGYYVVGSPLWDSSGAVTDAGAVTWVDSDNGHPYNETGPGAAVSSSNSLVGGSSEDFVGSRCGAAFNNACLYAVYTNESSLYTENAAAKDYQLANNKILIGSPNWDDPNSSTSDVGAVTLMPATGMAGVVTSANSLVGSNESDNVGANLAVLANGNYVVRVPSWDLGASQYDVGAVIWGDTASGITGPVTTANALHGTTFTAQPVNRPLDADRVGSAEILLLTNGNYVVVSPRWNLTSVITNTGAVTWVDGSNGHPAGAGSPGAAVSAANSLVGSHTQDQVGGSISLIGQGDSNNVAALSNGNYVVGSSNWDNGAVADAGAATWGNGATGITGAISSANSLVGATADDQVGSELAALDGNGNYVVVSPNWDNGGTSNVGAVTWGNGATGITGVVSTSNSLYGTIDGDAIGSSGVQALRNNSNYVVLSRNWDNGGTSNVGAVTWVNGATGLTGPVTTANSLYGSTAGDQVGSEGYLPENLLTNGNFVVGNSHWDNGAATDAGAATWINGATGLTGPVSVANSLVGNHPNDQVGKVGSGGFSYAGVRALSDGNYVVAIEEWNSFIGAVAWGNGATGTSGVVSSANALVGVSPGDLLLGGVLRLLLNGQYVVVGDAGSATWSRFTPGLTGPIGRPDTVFFDGAGGAIVGNGTYSELLDILAASRPADNKVTIMFPAWPVTVTVAGTGGGVVTSNVVTSTLTGSPNSQFWPEQIDCGITCTAHVRVNNVITLTATPNPGSIFTGWTGAGCNGTGECVVTANAAKEITVNFGQVDYGDAPVSYGEARHLASDGSIYFGATIDYESAYLASAGANGDDLDGSDDEDGIAAFPPLTPSSTSYNVSIPVTADPGEKSDVKGWIDFNNDGIFGFNEGALSFGSGPRTATLVWSGFTIDPNATQLYARFRVTSQLGGDAAGTPVDEVSTREDIDGEVEDYLILLSMPLTVVVNGTGTGTVTSTPAGIDCGADCDEVYPVNSLVTLQATPDPLSAFTGWSGGGCSGTSTCSVTMDAAKTITATFEPSIVDYVQSCSAIPFDSNAAGFRTASTNANRAVIAGPFSAPHDTNGRLFQWEATGGNPNGHLRAGDLDTEYQEVWTPVLGDSDLSSLIGRRLGFDYLVESNFNQYRLYVSVKGNNGNEYYFYFNDQLSAPNRWDRVSVPLEASQWHTAFEAGEDPDSGSPNSPAPSESDFLAVLSDLAHIAISVEGVQGFDITRLDNIGGDCDRGDAPASYGDPANVIAAGSVPLQLGSINGVVVDGEPFLQASAAANGDDNSGSDDENGVTVLDAFFGQLTAQVRVYPDLNDPTATPGTLCAWVDGSGPSGTVDGVFQASEGQCVDVAQAPACVSVFADANFACALTWDISNLPANSETFARFRVTNDTLTTADGSSGLASDGEIEDYRVFIGEYDSGDAPGLDFNNQTDVDGIPRGYGRAPHVISANPTFYLGTVPPDADATFLGGINADGDDGDGIDDEDGASFTVGMGVTAQITVTNDSGNTKVLEGFVDGQNSLNGVFGKSEEKEVTVPASGNNAACREISTSPRRFVCSLTWSASNLNALQPGDVTFARIRLSTTGSGNSTDTKPNGEVEDYRIDVPFNDAGDAPQSYGDAVHTLDNNLYIGAGVPDAETQPLYSAAADGDDLNATDDEDGLSSLPPLYTGSTGYSLSAIPVFNNTGSPATLYGWVDFNRNGTFDSGEGTSVSVPDSASAQNVDLTWGGLSGTVAGQSYVRLRLATQSGLAATGFTPTGEVEDYPLTIVQSGSLVVVKNATGGDASFPFSSGSLSPASFVLTTTNGTAQRTFASLVPGTYDLSENVPAGWQLESATCDDNSPVSAIDIGPGETVTCTFENTKQDTIVVIKRAVGGNSSFAFTSDLPNASSFTLSTIKGRATRVFDNVPPGTYNIAENVPAGWTASVADPICSNGDKASAITLGAGETVTCEFINLKQDTLVIEKVALGGDGSFAFSSPELGSFGLTSSNGTASRSFNNLNPGTYSITETVPAGWDMTGVTCTNGSSPDALTLTPGATVTCTFTNTQRASLTLVKQTQGGNASFDFTSTELGNFSLNTVGGTAQRTFDNLLPGTFTISETGLSGWDLTSATCSDGSSLSAVDLAPGEDVTCTVVNVKRGSLTVIKQVTGADATFTFASTSLSPASFDLTTSGGTAQQLFSDLTPGTYDLTENALSGWDPISATCSDGSAPSSINIAPGEDVTCTFANAQEDTIVVVKRAVGGDDSFDFTTTGTGLSNFSLATSGGSAQQTFTGLAAGTYSITETVPAGWRTTTPDPVCSNGDNASNIALGNGETVVCVFVNLKLDTLIIEKQTIGGDGTFDFTTTGIGLSDFSLTTSGGSAQQIFTNLNPGTYAITETAPAGWDLTGATCDNGTPADNITLPPGATVTCTFTNTQRAALTLIKQSIGGDGTFAFTSDLPGAASFDLTTNGGTTQQVFDNVVPGTYAINETASSAWDVTRTSCSDGSPLGAIDLTAGEDVTCTVINTKRASLTVVKESTGGDGTFVFTSPQLQNFSLTTSGGTISRTFASLIPGSYGLSERTPNGWDLIGATCSDGSNPASIRLSPGEEVTCTFRNSKRASLTIVKNTVGGDATFAFSGIQGGFNLTTQGGTASQTFVDVAPGPYAITESALSGWDVTSASCTNGDAPGSLTLAPGEDVTCTFENLKRGSLTVVKNATGGDTAFPFSSTSLTPSSFVLNTAGGTAQRAFTNLVPGTYDLAEALPSGWRQQSATCSDGSDPASISLDPGENVTCTFDNLKLDTIVMVKRAVGGDATFNFSSTALGDFDLTTTSGSQQQSFSNLAPGTYDIRETVPAGWAANVTDPVCSNGDNASRIALAAGETVVCVFVNLKQDTIVVEKVAVGGDANFTFSGDLGNFSLSTTGGRASRNFTNLNAGNFAINERAPAGWVQSGATCDNGQTPDALSVAPGATVTCTFTNTKLSTLSVIKRAVGGDATFDFSSDIPNQSSFSVQTIKGTAKQSFSNLTPGTYTLTEGALVGWDLTSATCSDGSDPAAGINLAPGENVTCSFVNTKRGSLTVVKNATGGDASFDFSSTTSAIGSFSLSTSGGTAQRTFSDLVPGSYDLTESLPAGWRQDSASCDDGSLLSAINIGPGEDVTCTFDNAKLNTITVIKRAVGGDASFTFTSSTLSPASSSLTTSGGTARQSFDNLTPGTYDISERVLNGWTAQVADPICSNGDPASAITLGDGEVAVCVFVNVKQDTLLVEKQTLGGDGTFAFTGSLGNFSLTTSGGVTTTAFANLNPGTYGVVESVPTGWNLTDLTCDNGNSPGGVILSPGATVTCSFENTQRGSLTIVFETIGGNGAQATFSSSTLTPSSFKLLTGSTDFQRVFDNLLPGQYDVTPTALNGDLSSAVCSDGSNPSSIDIGPGEDVTCTFTSVLRGRIGLVKRTTGGDGTFDFTSSTLTPNSFSITTRQGIGGRPLNNLVPGVYDVSESVPVGWDLTSASCSDGSPLSSVDVGPGENVTCTVENRKRGSVTIIKNTVGGDGSFAFTGDLGSFSLSTTGSTAQRTFTNLVPGVYGVSESVPVGWDQTGATCSDGSALSSINLGAGENVICTVTNTRRGSLTLVKNATGGDGSFSFSSGSLSPASFVLTTTNGTAQRTFTNLLPGSYDLSESVPTGWQQESATCSDGSSLGSIDIAPGENVTCTVENLKQDTIVIIKRAVGAEGSFAFNSNLPGNTSFTLNTVKGKARQAFANLPPGTYRITEALPSGWTASVADPVCSNGDNASSITLTAGESVVCEFVNLRNDTLVIEKRTVGGDGTFNFNSPQLGGFSLSTASGSASRSFTNLTAGTYVLSETVPVGWVQSGASCSDGSDPTSGISLAPGATVSCVFTNTKLSSINLLKRTVGGDATFNFAGDLGSFSIKTANGIAKQGFRDLAAGTYTISETLPSGWDLTSATCSDGSDPTAGVDLAPGEQVTCTFVNTRRGNLSVIKNTTGGDATFAFTSNSLTPSSFSLSTSGGTAQQTFANLVPGVYDLSETPLDGWQQDGITCSNGSQGGSINVGPGENVTCTVANTKLDTITVVKLAIGGDDTFGFSSSTLTPGSFDLTTVNGAAQQSFTDLAPGIYDVAENTPTGWILDGGACSDGSDPSAIDLSAGESVVCVFLNRKPNTIVIEKQAVGGDGIFEFTGDLGDFSLSTTGGTASQSFDSLAPGTYRISETVASGWDLTGITCDNGGDPTGVLLVAGETVTCRFENTRRGSLTLIKQSVGGDGVFDFGGDLGSFSLSTVNGTAQQTFSNLPPGTYSISESVPAGWDMTSTLCSDGSSLGAVGIEPGEDVICTVENTRRSSITVVKNTVGGDGSFDFVSSLLGDFSLTTTNSTAQRTFTDLTPGIYDISENVGVGWRLVSASCDSGESPSSVTVAAGADVTCTFVNEGVAAPFKPLFLPLILKQPAPQTWYLYLPLILKQIPPPTGPQVVYSSNFANGIGPGWSAGAALTTSPNGTSFLGELGVTGTALSLTGLPTHGQVTVSFDLYVIRSWDGNQVTIPRGSELSVLLDGAGIEAAGIEGLGPDRWLLKNGEQVLVDTTFTNFGDFKQSYPDDFGVGDYPGRTGAKAVNSLGYLFNDTPMDSTYRIERTFLHAADTLDLRFEAIGLQPLEDESWGLNTVTVTVE